MKVLGLDIGTTTISAVVVENGTVLSSVTIQNESFLPSENAWEKIQDPEYIRNTSLQVVEDLLDRYPEVERIGITGQMHGIVYLNSKGEPVTPLYTWQDGRGDLIFNHDENYVSYLSKNTGYSLATGYGLVTHFYNLKNGLIPKDATVFCTIQDYVAMVLAGLKAPVIEASDAASFGIFCVERGMFDEAALEKVGISASMLPKLAVSPCIGTYSDKISIYVAIGDNQASFLGATRGKRDAMLVNVGTGSQFSVYTKEYMQCRGLETRPFPGGGYLLVGASLCGGHAYALLESFIRGIVEAVTGTAPDSCYDSMSCILESSLKPKDLPVTKPLFQGSREDPIIRGSIRNISTKNFSIKHFIWSLLEGMVTELFEMYEKYICSGGQVVLLVGSGNGLRKNVHLQKCFEEKFGQPIIMSNCNEEAAAGAALYAQMGSIKGDGSVLPYVIGAGSLYVPQ